MVVLTFVVGHVADAFDRRRIGLVCQIIEAITLGIIALGVVQGWLGLPGRSLRRWSLLGSTQAFERPTMAALLPGIVTAQQLPRAIANSTSVMQTALVIGPALSGLLYGCRAGGAVRRGDQRCSLRSPAPVGRHHPASGLRARSASR